MRISDWSSDVCSSDLDAQRQHTATVKCLALSIERRDDAVNDILRHRGVHLAGKFDEARVDAEFARLPRQIERIDRNAVAADARTRIIRSEEHTSELQSLMRISYAVFYLKKTRPTRTTNH